MDTSLFIVLAIITALIAFLYSRRPRIRVKITGANAEHIRGDRQEIATWKAKCIDLQTGKEDTIISPSRMRCGEEYDAYYTRSGVLHSVAWIKLFRICTVILIIFAIFNTMLPMIMDAMLYTAHNTMK